MAGARGVYRAFPVGKLDDPAFQALTAQARLLYLALRLSPEAGIASIARIYPDLLRERTGLPAGDVAAALGELESGRWVEVHNGYAWVRDALRDDPSISLDNARQRAGIFNQLACLPPAADELVRRFLEAYGIEPPESLSRPGANGGDPTDSPSIAYREATDSLSIQGSVTVTGTATGTGEGSGAGAKPSAEPLPNPPGKPSAKPPAGDAASDAPRSAPARVDASAEEQEPARLCDYFVRLRRKHAPGAVVPSNLSGWTSSFAAMLQGGARPKDIERAMTFGFRVEFWTKLLRDPQALRKHLPRLLEQSEASEGRRRSADADREQAARARRAGRRPAADLEPAPGQATAAGTSKGLEALGDVIQRMGIAPAPEREQ